MGKLTIATDERAKGWPEKLQNLLNYAKKNPNPEIYKTALQLVQDNTKLFNRVTELEKEIEDGKTDGRKS